MREYDRFLFLQSNAPAQTQIAKLVKAEPQFLQIIGFTMFKKQSLRPWFHTTAYKLAAP